MITGNASPSKLKDGTWGARIPLDGIYSRRVASDRLKGQDVTIQTRSGKSWTATVAAVLWVGEGRDSAGVALVKTESDGGPPRTAGRSASGGGRRRKPLVGRRRKPLVGRHTENHCSCGNWSGPGSPCLYSYGEAKEEGEARYIEWS